MSVLAKMTYFIASIFFFFSSSLYAEREELESSPSLKDLIQEKFENIKEYRLQQHRWESRIRGVRKDHHFSLLLNASSGNWKGSVPESSIPIDYESDQYQLRGRYSFHIPLYKRLGYYLGSSFGISLGENPVGDEFSSRGQTLFPGVSLGFTWNVTPAVRLGLGGDMNIIRLENLKHDDRLIVSTARQRSGVVTLDLFFAISRAIRIEYSMYSSGLAGSNDLDLRRKGKGISIGLLNHLI